jgi:N-formylglutamate amidohydrolase
MKTKIKQYGSIVLNIPHSSTNIPEHFMPEDYGSSKAFYAERYRLFSRPLVDYYTDELFDANEMRITKVTSDICRTLCDVERMVNDPLEAEGYGIIYKRMLWRRMACAGAGSHVVFKSEFFDPTCKELLEYYVRYQFKLIDAIINSAYKNDKEKSVLLIDCHSFSSTPTALCDPGSQENQVDICIGYNDDATYPNQNVIDFIVKYFESFGYKVGCNTPFSHSKTVECPIPYYSLMIEVNKRCYMNEETLDKTEGFYRLQHLLQNLYYKILV